MCITRVLTYQEYFGILNDVLCVKTLFYKVGAREAVHKYKE